MSDDFERRLSVALKTAAPDLRPPAVGVTAVGLDPVAPVRRPRRPRVLLVTAVLLAFALVAGGAWWAVGRGAPTSSTPPADAGACIPADLDVSVIPTGGANDGDLALIRVEATRACTLAAAPTLLLDGAPLRWDRTPQDTTDDNTWSPLELPTGDAATFAIAYYSVAGGMSTSCAALQRQRSGEVDVAGRTTSFEVTIASDCVPLGFTTIGVPQPTAGGTCTAADVRIVPRDTGQGTASFEFEVVATTACALDRPPTVTVSDDEPDPFTVPFSGLRPGDETPWLPEVLQVGDTARFSVRPGVAAPNQCRGNIRDLAVHVAVSDGPPATFAWSTSACGLPDMVVLIGP